jgi:phosphoribosylanthranilate isomerase
MIVQIYTMQTPDEARAIAGLGVHHVGITPSALGLPGEVDLPTARAIAEAVRGMATTVALSVDEDLDTIEAMVRAVEPDILHLCGEFGAVAPPAIRELRGRLPGVRIMQAIPVGGAESVRDALAYQDVADYLILDTKDAAVTGVGASGHTHDWSISRAIVEAVRIPVILAGGLSPENVADAIRAVRPWGVDSLTHTNAPLPGGGFRKDLERVRAFARGAREAGA